MAAYSHESADHKRSGVDDMTLLSKIQESEIVENLKKRFMDDWIFTYIGPVLISVNPFKKMKYFTNREIEMYQGAAQYENPPHVYALADTMYRNMTIDSENQCVIISGESGAGKTVAAKFIMEYLSAVSGGGETANNVKEVILKSNPLLEAFGNAKTVRNNNSSRFGKYVEILFTSGQPMGGKVSNFLLEKSRVVMQNKNERNFHIFYQLIAGMDESTKNQFGLVNVDYYNYLNQNDCYTVDGTDDAQEYRDTMDAMTTMGMDTDEQSDVIQVVSGILHLGNILFSTVGGGETAEVNSDDRLDYPSYLLEVDKEYLRKKLISRVMESKWGKNTEVVDVTNNVQQADQTRDALAKGLYSRLFDYLVKRINEAFQLRGNQSNILSLGILDIYGFEIFAKNGFEQFCINFVNEKLQQIFIELTLKAEQEEYVQEGIAWTPIKYFNNAGVCELIEQRRPQPGIMAVLDDVSAQLHGVKEGADQNLKGKLSMALGQNEYFDDSGVGFRIHHYAGVVEYNVDGFVERNKDVFYNDLIELMQSSQNNLVRKLFPDVIDKDNKRRPITAGSKIKTQANELVKSLMMCSPSYIRTIKPNETKRPRDWDQKRVEHQVEYLGLKENIRVRRAGFAYRRPFEKFLHRYALLTKETWPQWPGDPKKGCIHILKSSQVAQDEYQMGKSKVFVKAPESLFLLEETRDKKIDSYARVIQKSFQKYFNRQKFLRQKEEAADIFYQKKQRRKGSLNRNFYVDYIGMDDKPGLKNLVGRRDKIQFAQTVKKYDRKYKGLKQFSRDLVVTPKGIFLVGREVEKQKGGQSIEVEKITRKIPFEKLSQVSLSTRQDDFVILHVPEEYDSLLQIPFKTEFVTTLKKVKEAQGLNLKITFMDKIEFVSDKKSMGAGKKRTITFDQGESDLEVIEAKGILKGDLAVYVKNGMSNTSKPKKDLGGSRPKMQTQRAQQNTSHMSNRTPKVGPGAPLPAIPTGEMHSGRGSNMGGPGKIPGAPRHQAPMSQPTIQPSVRVRASVNQNRGPQAIPDLGRLIRTEADNNERNKRQSGGHQQSDFDLSQIAPGGRTKQNRASIKAAAPQRPAPKRQRPPKPKSYPQAEALYDYQASDTDEISLSAGEKLSVLKEDESGWWTGRLPNGQEGFFPGAYVRKI